MSKRSAQNIFEKAARDYGISDRGKKWLIQAIDPYHDEAITPTGYPDANIAGSIVQVVKTSINVSAPAGVAGNWDAHVFNLPHCCSKTYTNKASGLNSSYDPLTNSLEVHGYSDLTKPTSVGGVVVIAGDPADATSPFANDALNMTGYLFGSTTSTARSITSLPLDKADYFGGNARVVAMGFEVVNTTSDLNRQGTVTTYRQPYSRDSDLTILMTESTSSATGLGSADLLQDAPGTLSDVMILSGTRQWKAADGGYCVCTLNSVENPSGPLKSKVTMLSAYPYDGSTLINPICSSVVYDTTGAEFLFTAADDCRFNQSGLYFTGLSAESTLTVNVIYYVERFPSSHDPTLAVLAGPSIGYDSVAFEMYSRSLEFMPPGVPQWENGIGDWFKSVVSAIPKVARTVAPALGMLPIPAAQVASQVASAIGQIGGPGKTYQPSGPVTALSQPKSMNNQQFLKTVQAVEKMLGRQMSKKERKLLETCC